MNRDDLVLYVEAALLCAGRPVAVDEFVTMFEGSEDAPDRSAVRDAIAAVAERWRDRAMEVTEVASGFRAQIRKEYSQAIAVLWQERPARYSRALLETLALIAYRQPISRGEIEEVRGVSVSSSIMKTLVEREWVRVVGHREAPGRPALFGTTKHFLDAFNLRSLESLPPLAELKDLDEPPPDLFTGMADVPGDDADTESPGTDTGSPGTDRESLETDTGSAGMEPESPETEMESPGTDVSAAAGTAHAVAAIDSAAPIPESAAHGNERAG